MKFNYDRDVDCFYESRIDQINDVTSASELISHIKSELL